jgi:hypothetical protein
MCNECGAPVPKDLSVLTVPQLKDLFIKRKLPVPKGLKADLVARLYEVLGTEPAAAAAKAPPKAPPKAPARPPHVKVAAAPPAAPKFITKEPARKLLGFGSAAPNPAVHPTTASARTSVPHQEPPALTDLIKRSLARCVSEADKVVVNRELQMIVARVISQGRMAFHNWGAERLPVPPSHTETPPALQDFIKRAFTQCATDADRAFVNSELHKVIAKVTAGGRRQVHNWGAEGLPIPPSYNTASSAGVKRKLEPTAAAAAAAAAALAMKVPKFGLCYACPIEHCKISERKPIAFATEKELHTHFMTHNNHKELIKSYAWTTARFCHLCNDRFFVHEKAFQDHSRAKHK